MMNFEGDTEALFRNRNLRKEDAVAAFLLQMNAEIVSEILRFFPSDLEQSLTEKMVTLNPSPMELDDIIVECSKEYLQQEPVAEPERGQLEIALRICGDPSIETISPHTMPEEFRFYNWVLEDLDADIASPRMPKRSEQREFESEDASDGEIELDPSIVGIYGLLKTWALLAKHNPLRVAKYLEKKGSYTGE